MICEHRSSCTRATEKLTCESSLSFYKESLDFEVDNYVHSVAAAEDKSPVYVLKELSEATLASLKTMEHLTEGNEKLKRLCRDYFAVSFSFRFSASQLDILRRGWSNFIIGRRGTG